MMGERNLQTHGEGRKLPRGWWEGAKRKEHALGSFGAIQARLQTHQRFASVVGGEVRGRVQSSSSACPENPWAMQDLWTP